jgi:hypothetical protein
LRDRAVFDAGPAAGASVFYNVTRALANLDLEIAGFAFNGFQIRVCDQLDIQVPADLDQYGGDDSHGAVVGGKRLVQLGHDAADGGGFLQKVNIIAGVREIQSGPHAGDAAADDQYAADYILCHRLFS